MAIIMTLRKAFKGTLGKVIMWGMFFVMVGGYGFSTIFLKLFNIGSVNGVALVNGFDISRLQFKQAVDQEEQRLNAIRQKYGQNADIYFKIMGINADPESTALLSVVYREIIKSFSHSIPVYVSKQYVENRLASDPRFLVNEFGEILPPNLVTKTTVDVPGALQFLKESGVLAAAYSDLEQKLTEQFAVLMIESGFFVPSFMIKQMYIEQKLAKKFGYQLFDYDYFVEAAKKAGATDEALSAFYAEQNKASRHYWSAEKRDGILWTFNPQTFGVTATSQEIEDFYAKTKSTRFIKDPVQIKVREIVFGDAKNRGLKALEEEAHAVHAQLVADASRFNELAKQYSTKKETAGKDGDFFKRGVHPHEYEKAAFKMKNDGDISEPTIVGEEYVILQRVARKEPTFQSLDQVRSDIEKTVLDQKFKTEFSKQANQLIRQDDLTQEAFDAFVKEHGGQKELLTGVEKQEKPVYLRLFSLRHEGARASMINEGKGVLIQLTKIKKAEATPLATIKAKVAEDYFQEAGKKQLEKTVEKAKAAALKAKKLVAMDGGKIMSTELANFSEPKVFGDYAKLGFPQGINELDKVGSVISSMTEKGGIVIQLSEIEQLKQEQLEEEKNKLLKRVYERNHELYLQSFIASLFRTATIKVNDELSRAKEQL